MGKVNNILCGDEILLTKLVGSFLLKKIVFEVILSLQLSLELDKIK